MGIIYQNESQVFERAVWKNGKLFRVRFVVIEREGFFRGRILSCEEVRGLGSGLTQTSRKTAYLPMAATVQAAPKEKRNPEEIISPFSALEFFMSQMTRAPSFSI